MREQRAIDPRNAELDRLLEGESWRGKPGPPEGSTWKCDPWFNRSVLQQRAAKMREKYRWAK